MLRFAGPLFLTVILIIPFVGVCASGRWAVVQVGHDFLAVSRDYYKFLAHLFQRIQLLEGGFLELLALHVLEVVLDRDGLLPQQLHFLVQFRRPLGDCLVIRQK